MGNFVHLYEPTLTVGKLLLINSIYFAWSTSSYTGLEDLLVYCK